MAALKLESLVLRGVVVVVDGVNVELRRGASYKAGLGTPEIPFSMRHPSQGQPPAGFAADADGNGHRNDAATVLGTGRSPGLVSVLSRSLLTATAVGRTTATWSGANGGNLLSTACLMALTPSAVAAGTVVNSRPKADTNLLTATTGLAPVHAAMPCSQVGGVWCKPASRTLPASTWGRGTR